MTYEEMMEKMAQVGSDGGSALHMRSEDLQHKVKVKSIPRLKNALKKKSKLLLDAELAFPFSIETGKAEKDGFNEHNKFRPTFSATTSALAIKEKANTNAALKETLMKRAGVTEWDTSNSEFTELDREIFGKYRVPRIFSLTVVHVNIPAMNTGVFGKDYAVSVKRDEDGKVVGEMPSFLLCNKFFRDKAYEEVEEYNKSIESGECKDDDQQQLQHRSNIYGRVPVSDDRPSNYVRLLEIPLDTSYEIAADSKLLAGVTAETLKDYEVVSPYKKGIRLAMEKYADGSSYKRYDTCFDFFDIEMSCPAEGDDSSNKGKAKIGQDTTFEKPSAVLSNKDVYGDSDGSLKTESLIKAIGDFYDQDTNIEKRMRSSMYTQTYDEQVENNILRTVKTVVDLDNDPYVTQKVLQQNQDFIRLAFPERDDLLEEIEAGVSDKPVGALDADGSSATAVSFDLTSDEFSDQVAKREEDAEIDDETASLDFGLAE